MRFWWWGAIAAVGAVLLSGLLSLQTFSPAAPSLRVDGQILQNTVAAIAQERFTDAELAATRAYISQQLNQAGYAVEQQPFDLQGTQGVNLIALRPGSDPTAGTILVGAHYDSVQASPGADDNASAVAAVLEIARLYAEFSTPATLKVVFFDQEELQPEGEGIVGSSAFVLNEENLAGLRGAIVLDMVGYACYEPGCQRYPEGLELSDRREAGDFIGVIGDTRHLELLEAFGPVEAALETDRTNVSALSADTVPVMTLPVPISAAVFLPDLFRSDHVPFWMKNIGAVMVTDTANFRNPNYHRASDTAESLDIDFLTGTAQKIVDVLETLLNRG